MTAIIIRWPRHIRQECNCEESSRCGYCMDGLFTCATCHTSEGELTTDCPGYALHPTIRTVVYAGVMDYTRQRGWTRLADGATLSNPLHCV